MYPDSLVSAMVVRRWPGGAHGLGGPGSAGQPRRRSRGPRPADKGRVRGGRRRPGTQPPYRPHRQIKWQRHLIAGLDVSPDRLAERLELLSAARTAEALQVAEALLADIAALAETLTDADISPFVRTFRTPPGHRSAR